MPVAIHSASPSLAQTGPPRVIRSVATWVISWVSRWSCSGWIEEM
ncbi:MAG: hypothetical protein ACXVW2_12625 [Nocardioidaceae bacterium]